MRCPKCDTVIPHHAKYCPKCGERSPANGSLDLPRAAGALPSTGSMPRIGKVLLILLAVAAGAVALGIVGRVTPLIFIGAGLVALLVLILLLGDLIGL